jgi:phosphonate transport system substrate-binding protein
LDRSSNDIVFLHDVNLGFPASDPEWAMFFRERGWRVNGYLDMGELTRALQAHAGGAAFLPAANYFFFRDDPFYAGLASALAMKTGDATVSSVLVVSKESAARSVLDLEGRRLGYINAYCTTSYFAPAILLAEQGAPFQDFFSLKPVGAWQRQVDALLAGDIDATMVEEEIWRSRAANQTHTKIIGRVERLPGPVIVAATSVDGAFTSAFLGKLHATRTARPDQPFAGYAPYRADAMKDFFERSARAFPAVAASSPQLAPGTNKKPQPALASADALLTR